MQHCTVTNLHFPCFYSYLVNVFACPKCVWAPAGYLSLPPCIWSEDPKSGLPSPPLLRWDTNLTAVKRCNSTYGHTGEMARWQGHGILV